MKLKSALGILGPSTTPLLAGFCGAAVLHAAQAGDVLPPPEAPFKGRIEFNARDSAPDWPQPVTAPKGAPNIVLVLVDDAGFGAASTFGGPAETPELNWLAAHGLRYNRFHVTALCSPTRAALLTGRNDHRVGFGTITDLATGYPGYDSIWRKDTVSIAEVLRRNGYSTAAFGKWHNTPLWEVSPVGPFDRWPTGLGFEYFYGFMTGNDDQWEPTLYRNTTLVRPPATPEQGYYFNTDIADDAIRWVHTHESLAPDKPYFLYFAPGATHAPHQVPRQWIDKYRGRFDEGWDKLREEIFARQKKLGVIPADTELTPRPPEMPAWDSLSADEKKVCARQMEVYAAYLEETDFEVGRLLHAVQQEPGSANTIILYIVGDNGADAKGGRTGSEDYNSPAEPVRSRLEHLDAMGSPQRFNLYASGWAWAMCTPFQWEKRVGSHLGGTRDPLVVVWPDGIKDAGGLRTQYTHVNDVAPTLCELAGIPFPTVVNGVKQLPLDGTSFAYTFTDANAPSRHRLQIFEQNGNRAIYQDGWVAAVRHSIPWLPISSDYSHDRWELYHLDTDYSEAHDLAALDPEKLREMQALFEAEARKNDIYPLTDGAKPKQPLMPAERRHELVFYPDMMSIPSAAAPNFEKSYRITVDAIIPPGGAEGVLVSDGSRAGGFVFFLKNSQLTFQDNVSGFEHNVLSAVVSLPQGKVEMEYQFVRDDGPGKQDRGTGRLYFNGQMVGEAKFDVVGHPIFGTFDIGEARTARISDAYQMPFKFTGTLETVRVEAQ
ncbi:MAG TPA: arylsulfatase [Opitutaceae bacterium]|nr:arylsulfatase [Opitutaceae bacterium]